MTVATSASASRRRSRSRKLGGLASVYQSAVCAPLGRTLTAAIHALLGLAVLSLVDACGQDTRPGSRPGEEIRRFEQVSEAPDLSGAEVVVSAVGGTDTITVLSDGRIYCRIDKLVEEERRPTRRWREYWVARISPRTLKEIEAAVSQARARSETLWFDEVADLARVPSWVRKIGTDGWWERHQEPDGSWSPAAFDWNCTGSRPCSGTGQESFRLTTTALVVMAQVVSQAGVELALGSADSTALRGVKFLLARQRPDGGLAQPEDPAPAMTEACSAIALCRSAALSSKVLLRRGARTTVARIPHWQGADGSFGDDPDPSRRLATAVWSLFALKAAATARIPTDPEVARRGLAWIEKTVADLEARTGALAPDVGTLARARASRAVGRLSVGTAPAALAGDLDSVLQALRSEPPRLTDAETILFAAILQSACRDHRSDGWGTLRKLIVDTRAPASEGCSAGTWLVPSVWQELGGRLVSTALMTWAFEVLQTRSELSFPFERRRLNALWLQ